MELMDDGRGCSRVRHKWLEGQWCCKCQIPHWTNNYVKPHPTKLCMGSSHTAPTHRPIGSIGSGASEPSLRIIARRFTTQPSTLLSHRGKLRSMPDNPRDQFLKAQAEDGDALDRDRTHDRGHPSTPDDCQCGIEAPHQPTAHTRPTEPSVDTAELPAVDLQGLGLEPKLLEGSINTNTARTALHTTHSHVDDYGAHPRVPMREPDIRGPHDRTIQPPTDPTAPRQDVHGKLDMLPSRNTTSITIDGLGNVGQHDITLVQTDGTKHPIKTGESVDVELDEQGRFTRVSQNPEPALERPRRGILLIDDLPTDSKPLTAEERQRVEDWYKQVSCFSTDPVEACVGTHIDIYQVSRSCTDKFGCGLPGCPGRIERSK